jgi:hypothetical protein
MHGAMLLMDFDVPMYRGEEINEQRNTFPTITSDNRRKKK